MNTDNNTNEYSRIVSTFKKLIIYLVEGLTVAVIIYLVFNKTQEHLLYITLTAAASLALIDTFASGITLPLRQGIGFTVGAFGISGITGLPFVGVPTM